MKKASSGLKADRPHVKSFEFLDDYEEECEVLEINSGKRLICIAHARVANRIILFPNNADFFNFAFLILKS